jgi:predicted glycosyltransferase
MRIIHYCQHIWGVGHFFRTLEICRALADHEIILVTGGPEVTVDLPAHVRSFRLPGLMTDRNYDGLFPTDTGRTLEDVRRERKKKFYSLFEKERPDAVIIELYPFGRKAFGFELNPVLEDIRAGRLKRSAVFCSLRDILVEKNDQAAYEARVVDVLNRHFDALLIHADPNLVTLDRTFSRVADLEIPVVYTGYIAPKPPPDSGRSLRRQLGIDDRALFVVASAGGGKAGIVVLAPLLESIAHLNLGREIHLHVFTGPFMPEDEFTSLARQSNANIKVRRFTSRFLSYLMAADLSVSMGGYNTSMNILTTGVPALIWPYPGDHEQGLRAARLADIGVAGIISARDLQPAQLAELVQSRLVTSTRSQTRVDLEGAVHTAEWLIGQLKDEAKPKA